ncbi:MAG: cob(I)yrinic acid a,c-diamide adenosyltransferase [Candidatus Lindowbacteria bacterium]|nr:cob(I)yrinic acid a,c-diamide adenosyltransferase [Candidatus Lindowbacteria bacterium]
MEKTGIRIYKTYTRTGDDGTTGIIGGVRVKKDSLRIESYGTTDELQAHLGAIWVSLKAAKKNKKESTKLAKMMKIILNDMFDLGSMLATPFDRPELMRNPITPDRIKYLEDRMDEWTPQLKPLPSFTLSGGGEFSVKCHIARTVCRRAERVIFKFARKEDVPEEVLHYINRLSDFLFVLGRYLATLFKEEEALWDTPLKKPLGSKNTKPKSKTKKPKKTKSR